jgi:hypothetical protein
VGLNARAQCKPVRRHRGVLNPRSRRAALDVEHGGRNTNADVAYLFRPLESDGRQVRRLLRFRCEQPSRS